MKISVIIPYYKAEKWLKRCLDSVTRQQGNLEIITIDDNGTEPANETLADFAIAAQYIDIIRIAHQNNQGVSAARNSGLDAATGDWITFLDADDEWLKDAYDTLEKAITAAPHDISVIELNHQVQRPDHTIVKNADVERIYSLGRRTKNFYGIWNKLYKREFIEKYHLRFDEEMRFGEDEEFNIRCMEADNRIYHAPADMVALKRHHDNPDSLARNRSRADLCLQSQKLANIAATSIDADIREAICDIQVEHWSSKCYHDTFGGITL